MSVQTTYSTLRDPNFAGTIDGDTPKVVETMRNDAAVAMAFGTAVAHGSATDEYSADVFTAITGEKLAGIVLHQHTYAQTQLDATGVLPTNLINVVRKGRMWVICEDGCSVGDPLHIQALTAGGKVGELAAAADGVNTIDCSAQGQWRSSAAAGELAILEFDFTNSPT